MRIIEIILMITVMTGIVMAQASPYPVYGVTNPNVKVSATSDIGTISTASDKNGNYQLELSTEWVGKTVKLSYGSCSTSMNLPNKVIVNYDYKCSDNTPIEVGVASVAAVGIAAYAIKKRAAKKKSPKKPTQPKPTTITKL